MKEKKKETSSIKNIMMIAVKEIEINATKNMEMKEKMEGINILKNMTIKEKIKVNVIENLTTKI